MTIQWSLIIHGFVIRGIIWKRYTSNNEANTAKSIVYQSDNLRLLWTLCFSKTSKLCYTVVKFSFYKHYGYYGYYSVLTNKNKFLKHK